MKGGCWALGLAVACGTSAAGCAADTRAGAAPWCVPLSHKDQSFHNCLLFIQFRINASVLLFTRFTATEML